MHLGGKKKVLFNEILLLNFLVNQRVMGLFDLCGKDRNSRFANLLIKIAERVKKKKLLKIICIPEWMQKSFFL